MSDHVRFCPNCGAQLPSEARFCRSCGSATTVPRTPQNAAPSDLGRAGKLDSGARGADRTRRRVLSVVTVLVSLLTLMPLLSFSTFDYLGNQTGLPIGGDVSFPGLAAALVEMGRIGALAAAYQGGSASPVVYYALALLVLVPPALAIVRSCIGCYQAFCDRGSMIPAGLLTSLLCFCLPLVVSFASRTLLQPTPFLLIGLLSSASCFVYVLASGRYVLLFRKRSK